MVCSSRKKSLEFHRLIHSIERKKSFDFPSNSAPQGLSSSTSRLLSRNTVQNDANTLVEIEKVDPDELKESNS